MSRESIVAEVRAEIARLQQVLALLGQEGHGITKVVDGRSKAGRAARAARAGNGKPRRQISAAARARISRIQKARWAKWRKEQGK
jgi:hypothetical protein